MRFLMFLLVMFIASTVYGKTPIWVDEYRNAVKSMSHKKGQSSLAVLEQTHRGNCRAFSRLAQKITSLHGVKSEWVEVKHNNGAVHRLTLVSDGNGVWCVSNDDVNHFKNEEEATQLFEWNFRDFSNFSIVARESDQKSRASDSTDYTNPREILTEPREIITDPRETLADPREILRIGP